MKKSSEPEYQCVELSPDLHHTKRWSAGWCFEKITDRRADGSAMCGVTLPKHFNADDLRLIANRMEQHIEQTDLAIARVEKMLEVKP